MALLRPPSVSSRFFSFHASTNTFVTERSDLPNSFREGRVYDDACDEGFTMVSERTGREVVFAQNGADHNPRDREEIAGWRYVCVTPKWKHLKALIIND